MKVRALLLVVAALAGGTGGSLRSEASGSDLEVQRWSLEDGLPQSTVTAITQDAKGYLWLGTEAGLVRFDGLRFAVYDRSNTPALRTDHISALLVGHDEALWIGTRNGLVRHQRGQFQTFTEAQGLPDNVVEALAMGARGGLWVGTRGGLCLIPQSTAATCAQVISLQDNEIFALAVGSDDDLWVGLRGGLRRLRKGQVEAPPTLRRLEDRLFLSLESDSEGFLWAGSAQGGLFRVDSRSLQPTLVEGTEQEIILSIQKDPMGALWLGTRKGLKYYEGETLTQVQELTEDTIYTLFRDGSDHLWVGTRNDGVFRLPLPNAMPPIPPAVLIEEVRVDGVSRSPEELTVDPPRGRGDLEFRFTAVEFSDPDAVEFRHFLEGYQATWSEPIRQRYASYTNLPPGHYRLRVRLADPRLAGSSSDAEIAFRVAPLFYQTPFFRLGVVLLLALLLRILYQWRIRRLIHTQSRLESLLKEHTQELVQQKEEISTSYRHLERANKLLRRTNRELTKRNREKSDFLAIATHDLRAPLVNLKGFTAELAFAFERAERFMSEAIPHLNPTTRILARKTLDENLPEFIGYINSSAQRIEALIDPILKVSRIQRRSLQLRPVSLQEIVEGLVALNRRKLEAEGILCDIVDLGTLLSDESILHEILEHLFKHTFSSLKGTTGGTIMFNNHRTKTETVVSIRRNGPPSDRDREERAFRLFGRNGVGDETTTEAEMTYARALIQRLGGRIWIRQQADSTSIYFSIPINPGQTHQKT